MILLAGKEVKFGRFPNGESNLNFNNISFAADSEITFKYESDLDLINLFVLKRHMDDVIRSSDYRLRILYMPYSRMDRRNGTYAFSLKYFCEFINGMDFAAVTVFDPHSDVTPALVNRCVAVSSILDLFSQFQAEGKTENVVIFYPDSGAKKRFAEWFAYPSATGSKLREFTTGRIQRYEISDGEKVSGRPVVIIDDLCSRGGTFIAAAKQLKELGAGEITLIVGHCEKTIFDGEIFRSRLIEKVYTTNSIISEPEGGFAEVIRDRIYIQRLY